MIQKIMSELNCYQQLNSRQRFRYDINGIRGIAVIIVILFHYQIQGFSAGFLGVDIFFVISGFLMTSIIIHGLEEKRFSILEFYLARAKRIIPALLFMILVILVLGWFILPDLYYKELGGEAASSVTFLSNIFYWQSTGYFDTAAHEKWLLHTWSLSVEWQFYLIYPFLMAFLSRYQFLYQRLITIFILLIACSFFTAVWGSIFKPTASFYLLPTRVWEMLAGGLVFLLGRHLKPNTNWYKYLNFIGWLGLALSLLIIDASTTWPAALVLLPVLSISIIILLRDNSVLTNNAVMQWFGTNSYSLYLWHWPIFVCLNYFEVIDSPAWIFLGLALSIILARLSYLYVETPVRYAVSTKVFFARTNVSFYCSLICVSVMSIWVSQYSFDGRIDELVNVAAAESLNRDPRRPECFNNVTAENIPGCIYGSSEEVGAILWGDSHSSSVVSALSAVAAEHGSSVAYFGMHSCPTLFGTKYVEEAGHSESRCEDFNQAVFLQVKKFSKDIPVVVVNRTSAYLMGPNEPDRRDEVFKPTIYFEQLHASRFSDEYQTDFSKALVKTACTIAKDRDVYFMRPLPEYGISVPKTMAKRLLLAEDYEMTLSIKDYHERNEAVWAAQDRAATECGIEILDPTKFLCDKTKCYASREQRPFYSDDDHLSEYGNKFIKPIFHTIFR